MATAVKAVLLRHMKSMGEKAKQYAGGHVAALAQAVADAMEEMDTAKADKPQHIDLTIPTTGWQTDAAVPGYAHYLDIPVAGLTANDRVEVDVAPASKAVADAARFTATQSLAGVLRLRAANVPAAAITAQYHISAGYVAAEETEAT